MRKSTARHRNPLIERVEKRVLFSAAVSSAVSAFFPADATPMFVRVGKAGSKPDGYSSPNGLGLTAAQMRGAYGLGQVGSSTITFNGVQGDGTGQTIAFIDEYNDPNITTDLATFDSAEGLPSPPSFKVLNQSGQTSPLPSNSATSGSGDWSSEESLDVEWAHAMAPGANLILFECTNLLTGDATAAAYAGVTVVSNSWGSGESSSEASSEDPYFTTPNGHPGVTFLASTGDTGAQISYPAESNNVVAVGGTQLSLSGNSWSSETTWSSGGGGTSAYESQPSFQAGTITSSKREDPDISLDASPNSGVPIVDSWDNSASAPWSGVWGGTSLSSPMMGAMVAIADQGRAANGLSSLNSLQTDTRLYQLSTANFHDITTGSNGHSAVVGYDEATGIGSAIGNVLIPNLAGSATVTGRVFEDNAGTGVYATGDPTLAGQTVYLDLNGDGKLDNGEPSTTTNSAGIYTFTDQPAGGKVILSTAGPSGYTLESSTVPTLSYSATDTANFVYNTSASKLAITQQPAPSTAFGTPLGTISVAVENSAGTTVSSDASTVTLKLSAGTFTNGSTSVTATAVSGVATFTNLQTSSAGTYTLTASDGSLTAATSTSFAIYAVTPTIHWTTPAGIGYGTALSAVQLNATASVQGTFTYTPALGSVPAAGSSDTLSVVFTPSDATDYTSASATTTLSVAQAVPTVTWPTPAAITYGIALTATQLDATASVPGTFVYTPAAGSVPTAGSSDRLSVVFTPTDATDYTSASATTTLTVAQAVPQVSWPTPSPIVVGTALTVAQLDATANVQGTFVYNPAAGTVLSAGAGQQLNATFIPADSTDYTTASGSTTITVNPPAASPVSLNGSSFYLQRSGSNLDIWNSASPTGAPDEVTPFASVTSLTLSASSQGDNFVADFSGGSIVPAGGLNISGNGSAAANSLTIVGTGGSDTISTTAGGSSQLAGAASVIVNGQTVSYNGGSIGNLYYTPTGTASALTVSGGTISLSPATTAGITTDTFSNVTIADGAELAVPTAGTHATRILLQTGTLNLAGNSGSWTGTLDLSNNDMVVTAGNITTIDTQIAANYATAPGGIISSAARADTTQLTTLGVIQNSVDGTPTAAPLFGTTGVQGTFDGTSPADSAVLIKYTYYGDANLNGTVDGSDYSRIDAAYGSSATGWFNGDFNYDGSVDGSDYSLIDNAYNNQQSALPSAQVASESTQVAAPSVVSVTAKSASAKWVKPVTPDTVIPPTYFAPVDNSVTPPLPKATPDGDILDRLKIRSTKR